MVIANEYILIERQPVIYEDIGDHELVGIYENAEALLAAYSDRLERARMEILRRASEREEIQILDRDYICDVMGEAVFVRWRDGHGPWHQERAS